MTDRLTVVIVDDRAQDSRQIAREASDYFDFYEVSGIDEVAVQIARLSAQPEPIVDIILCDVNMERDNSAGKFTIAARDISFQVKSNFAIKFNEAGSGGGDVAASDLDHSHDFKPYGPVLALPFTQFFSGGGVTEPISAFWNDSRLIQRTDLVRHGATAEMNGYAYVALRLIWELECADSEDRDTYFASRLSEAYRMGAAGNGNVMIERLKRATAKRRAQLFERAKLVQGLAGTTAKGLVSKEGEELVTIWDEHRPARQLRRSSLFGDFTLRMHEIGDRGLAGERFISHEEDELAKEIRKAPTHPDPQRIRELCMSFVDVLGSEEPPTDFEGLYLTALDESGGCDATLPAARVPRDLPSYLRRYLLLSVQLYLASLKIDDPNHVQPEGGVKPEKSGRSLNVPTRKALGLDQNNSHEPREFIYGRRPTGEEAVAASNADPWLRPFWRKADDSIEADGWRGFNIRRTPEKDEHRDWTPLDRWVAQAVWKRLNQPDPCLFELGGPTMI